MTCSLVAQNRLLALEPDIYSGYHEAPWVERVAGLVLDGRCERALVNQTIANITKNH